MSNLGTTPAPRAPSTDDTSGMALPTSAGRGIDPSPPPTPSTNLGTGPVPGSVPAQRALPSPRGSSSSSSRLPSLPPRAPSSPPSVFSAAVPAVSIPLAGSRSSNNNSRNSNPALMPPTLTGDPSPPPLAAQPRVQARRTGARSLDIHVHWADEEPETVTAAPAAAPATGPPNAGVQAPPTSYKSPAPMNSQPQAYTVASGQPVWGRQVPMPVLVTNPPMMAPSVPPPAAGSTRWCYPTRNPPPFGNNTAYYLTSPQPVVFPPVPTVHVATPVYASPQSSVIFYPTG